MKNQQPRPQQSPQPENPLPPPSAEPSTSELPPELEHLAGETSDDQAAQPGGAAPGGPAPPDVPTADFLAGMLAPAFEQLAPNWKVKQHEVKMLAIGWGAVLDHYFPGGVNAWGPWGVALAATAAVIGPRINIPPQLPPPAKGEPAAS